MLDELWMHAMGTARDIVGAATRAEKEGWDGLYVPGSPLLVADPWVCIALAASETSRLFFGTGLVTPLPEIAAALAGSSTTVQRTSAGRVVLGVGRGDLGTASLGMGPMLLGPFERYVARVQAYLRGEEVGFDLELDAGRNFPRLEGLDAPQTSKLSMYMLPDESVAKVPLEVFASGPKVIEIAARHVDRLTFGVGAEADRVSWAISTATTALHVAGRTNDELSFGAVVPIFAHPDRDLARAMLAGAVSSMARFSVMQGKTPASVTEDDKAVYRRVHREFTFAGHFSNDPSRSPQVPAEFIDRFAVIGTTEECVERLEELVALGITRFSLGLPGMGISDDASSPIFEVRRRVVEEVIPELRSRCGSPRT